MTFPAASTNRPDALSQFPGLTLANTLSIPTSPFSFPLTRPSLPCPHSQEATPNILSLWRAMPWWRLYASNVPPAPQQPYFTVMCAKKATVALLEGPHSVPFPGSQMGE